MKNRKLIFLIMILILVLGITIFMIINNKNNNYNNDNESKKNQDLINKDIDKENGEDNNMNEFNSKINMNINGTNFSVTLENNETSRELLNSLPLEIEMKELNGNEKYYYFNRKFSSNSNKVEKLETGDIMLYGSNCLVLFYETFNTSYSYTRIGKIDNPDTLKNVVGKGTIKVSITK